MVPIHESYPKIYPACDVSLRRPMPPDLPHQEGPTLTSLDRGSQGQNFEVSETKTLLKSPIYGGLT
jgi:hypothetical protein